MTVYEFLLKTGVDIKDNKSTRGNNLEAELCQKKIKIDFEADVKSISDELLYEIGRIIIPSENNGTPFWSNEILDMMKELVEKYTKN